MREEDKKEYLRITEQNISYYNAIAASYDAILNEEISNQSTRKKVADLFLKIVKPGTILDFGGGTGKDLGWLTSGGYKIIFCEPSIQMRNKAIERHQELLQDRPINFLEAEKTDFTKWNQLLPPFPVVDAILANFAVFNCIPDLGLLFKNLSGVIRPGGVLVALILHNHFPHLIKSHFRSAVKSIFFQEPVRFRVKFDDHQQTVFVHSMRDIKKNSSPYFNFCEQKTLRGSGFVLIHLTRK